MGLFQHKKQTAPAPSPEEQATEEAAKLFDDEFREELRGRGRAQFERIIEENAALFKQDLDATVTHINTELRQHAVRQLDEQFDEITRLNNQLRDHVLKQLDEHFTEYSKSIEAAQGAALEAVKQSAEALHAQHQALGAVLEKSISEQTDRLSGAFEETELRVTELRSAEKQALESLQKSVESLAAQNHQLEEAMEKAVSDHKTIVTQLFEKHMAQVVEHYLLEALGDQYDIKAQLPSIIKQMEAHKQAMVDDLKL